MSLLLTTAAGQGRQGGELVRGEGTGHLLPFHILRVGGVEADTHVSVKTVYPYKCCGRYYCYFFRLNFVNEKDMIKISNTGFLSSIISKV
jgi:hypothetical protein